MNDSVVPLVLAVAVTLVAVIFGVSQPYFEAKAFNECTGGNARYFTAAFTELRVQDCNR